MMIDDFDQRVARIQKRLRKGRTGMDNPPIILGEAPSKSGDKYHMFPLSGAVAETLCKLAGIPPQADGTRYGKWTWALYDHFECDNLIERWPGAQGRGSAFPLDVAGPLAFKMAEDAMLDRVVVLLGARLRGLFGLMDFYRWCDHVQVTVDTGETLIGPDGFMYPNMKLVHCPCHVVAIPHPSGLNRMLNDSTERDRCGDVLRKAMSLAKLLDAPTVAFD